MEALISPTLYPRHAHLLCVGEDLTDHTSEYPRSKDRFGTWELHKAPLEALERAIKLSREDGSRRVMLDVADCLCLGAQDWRGKGVANLARFSSRQPSGSIVMTRAFQSTIMAHVEDHNDLAPLLTNGESTALSLFQPASQVPTHERSNLVLEPSYLVGREAALGKLSALLEAHRGVVLWGGVGVGKSALARAYGTSLALHAPDREVWWLPLGDCDTTRGFVQRLAKLFNLTLPPDETLWPERISAMLQNRPLSPTVILDDTDALGEDALGLLEEEALRAATEAKWIVTSRRGATLDGIAQLELEPLDEASSLALLMKGGLSSAAVEDMDVARDIWMACSGHPASLTHARHHSRRIGAQNEGDLDDAFSEQLRLARDWSLFDEDDKLVLRLLGKMLRSTSASMLETLLLRNVDVHIARLERIGWIQRDPSTPRMRWSVPGLFKSYVERQTPAEVHEQIDALRADALLRYIDVAFNDLRTNKQPEALATLRHHEEDIWELLAWGLRHRQQETLGLIARMRLFYTMAHNSFAYLPLIEQARAIVDAEQMPGVNLELELSHAIFADYNPNLTMSADELYLPLLERADEFSPLSRAELFYHRAIYLEDLLENAEVIQECSELLVEALRCLEHAQALDQRASIYCAMARIELARSELDLALDYAFKGREAAIANGSHLLLGTASFALHRTYLMKGDRVQAQRHGQRALEEMEKANATPSSIMALASLGYMNLLQGNVRLSQDYLYRALQHSMANSYEFGVMNCHYLLGLAHLLELRWEHARDHLLAAEKLQVKYSIEWNINQNKIAMSILHAGVGELTEARDRWQEAHAYFADCPNPEISDFLAMARFAPEVYRAAWLEGDRARLDVIEAEIKGHHFSNDMERGAHQGILLAFIEAARHQLGESTPRKEASLRFAADGSSFCLPGGVEEVDLSRRRTVKRVLAILVKARVENPGEVLDAHTLVERGWPGEVFEVRAGLMRLYVTINTLRKLGLEEILQTHGEGYRLDPDLPLEVYGQLDEADEA